MTDEANKALELGNAMYNSSPFNKTKKEHLEELVNAKRCAEVAVNEIIRLASTGSHNHTFYQKVLIEIQKL